MPNVVKSEATGEVFPSRSVMFPVTEIVSPGLVVVLSNARFRSTSVATGTTIASRGDAIAMPTNNPIHRNAQLLTFRIFCTSPSYSMCYGKRPIHLIWIVLLSHILMQEFYTGN